MSRLLSLTIRTQLFLVVLIVTLAALGLIIYSGLKLRDGAINEARNDTSQLAEGIASEQQSLIASAQQLILALAQLPDVKQRNAAKVESILKDILRLNSQYSNIFIADKRGLVWATAVPVKPPFIVADRRYFKNSLTTGQLSSGEYVISRATSRPAFNVAFPLKNDAGDTIGVICVGFVLDAFKEVLKRANLPSGSSFLLLDHKGVVLYRPINPPEYIGKHYDAELFRQMRDGPETATSILPVALSGDKRIVTYKKMHLPGEKEPFMYVRAGIPLDSVLMQANKTLKRNMAIFTSFIMLAFWLAWVIGKRSIADRITLLVSASQRMANGDLQVRVADVVEGGELGNLAKTFDAMAQEIAVRGRALSASERNYREIFNSSQDTIFVHEAESGKILEVNKTFEEMYGYSRDEISHLTLQELSSGEPPYTIQEGEHWIRKTIDIGPQSFEWLARGKSGKTFWVEVMLSATSIGGEGRVLAVVRNIDEWKRAEEEQRKLVSIIETSSDLIGIADLDGNLLYLNASGQRLLGIASIEDVRSKSIRQFHLEADYHRFEKEILPSICQTGRWTGEVSFRHFRTGEAVPVEMNAFLIRDPQTGQPIAQANISRDIRERRRTEQEKTRLESQLLQAQKLELVGRLAGGVAHDFNNMLSVILGYAELIKQGLPEGNPLSRDADEIQRAAIRSRDITRQLLAFSRQQIIEPRPVDLNDLVKDTQKTLARLIGEDIELCFYPGKDLWTVRFDSSHFDQILINLAVNARDAMPDGGKLIIETSNVILDLPYCCDHAGFVPGDYVLLVVSDSGMGMDKETLSHVFEPFFTTKEVDKGTGLGLATVYGIVTQNRGFINVYSEPGRGTAFKIYFPRIAAGEDEKKEKIRETEADSDTGAILLVEDDEMVRSVATALLKEIGYTVLAGKTPLEALSLLETSDMPVDLILTDVVMPGMKGTELRDRAKLTRPGIKVLFMSGYTTNVIVHHGILEEGVHFIQKPFSLESLAQKVREAMRG